MRRLALIAGSLLVVLIVALMTLRIVGLDPKERRPGMWLKGALVTTPVTDWSFTDRYPTIFVQTQTWYGIPHSITTSCVARDGQLYVTSVYRAGARFPRDRFWNRNVIRDPHVRLKIGDQLFDRTLSLVTDPSERAAVLESKAKKYPNQHLAHTSTVYIFRVSSG